MPRRRWAAACLGAAVGMRAVLPVHGADAEAPIESAADRLARARRIVVFSGAGMSAESGIRTYRDAAEGGGLWDGFVGRLGMLVFGTKVGFLLFPHTAWRLYCEKLLIPIRAASPNPGHGALAALEGVVAPARVSIITQNVDGLHQRAGSTDVCELHGTCATHRNAWTSTAVEVPDPVDPGAPPALWCRPNAVLFFEGMPPAFWTALSAVEELGSGDVMIVVGASCAVAPACLLPIAAMSRGCHVLEVNFSRFVGTDVPTGLPNPDGVQPPVTYGAVTDLAPHHTLLQGRAASVLPALVAAVQARLQAQVPAAA